MSDCRSEWVRYVYRDLGLSMVTILLAALAPALIWLWYFYRKDKRPEPMGLIGLAFLAGAVVVWPTCLIQERLLPILPELSAHQDFDLLWVSTTVLAGFVEETLKFLIVLGLFLWHHEFDEPIDCLIYAAAVAMGFTAGENFVHQMNGLEWERFLSPPGHAMFAAFWGYGLGVHMTTRRWGPVLARLGLAILVHGLWDALAIYRDFEGRWWVSILVFLLAFSLYWAMEQKLAELQVTWGVCSSRGKRSFSPMPEGNSLRVSS